MSNRDGIPNRGLQANRPPISGFLNLYKTPGPTSMDMVRQIKGLTGQRKRVGHGGTLDPLAEGVLPICFGQATRLMEYLVERDREYYMEVFLGATTSTYDAEGEVVAAGDPSGLSSADVEESLKAFLGIVFQTPPMYSAIKVKGERLYQLARSGVEVERQPRKVEIADIELIQFQAPSLILKVVSGRGAYMRSLAHDLGAALGCGAYLKKLVRLRSGPFKSEEAVLMSKLQEADGPDGWEQYLQTPDYALLHMKGVAVAKAGEKYLRSGQSISLPPDVSFRAGYMEKYRAYTDDGRFLAVLSFDKPRNQWQPDKVFALGTPSPYAPGAGDR